MAALVLVAAASLWGQSQAHAQVFKGEIFGPHEEIIEKLPGLAGQVPPSIERSAESGERLFEGTGDDGDVESGLGFDEIDDGGE